MSVALTETAVIALHGRLDDARCIVIGANESILTEAHRLQPVSTKLAGLFRASEVGADDSPHVPLYRRTNQQPQLVVVHSTKSS